MYVINLLTFLYVYGKSVPVFKSNPLSFLLLGPKVEKLSPTATFLGSALTFHLYMCLMIPSANLFEYNYCTQINSLSSLADSRSKNAAASKF